MFILVGCKEKEENKQQEDISEDYKLNLIKSENCNHVLKEYYTYENRTVYLVCLDEIYFKQENVKDMTLKYHLQNVNQPFDISIEKLVSNMDLKETLKDGGTKLYKKDDYTIILCNTLDSNKDIYIGDVSLEYQEGFCK